jgi:HSF-type DNA-binding
MSTIVQDVSRGTPVGSAVHSSSNDTIMQPFPNASESVPADPMDMTAPSSASMGPPVNSSPEIEHGGNVNGNAENNGAMHTSSGAGAMAAAPGPKVVQTAFIHKLYNMLEDKNIQHLISWSNTNESFVMSPSTEFSRVLAQYFKHTNISSFVRQLNMYGFHKVSDVFHTGSPDSTLWEFRHGNGNFKKGDLAGLREIKRRASRHALIHRDSFSGHKSMQSQPGTPAEPVPDTLEQRMAHMENAVYRMGQRISRNDDNLAVLNSKCQTLTEGLVRCHQVYTSGRFD